MKNIIMIRPELPQDLPAIHYVNKQAFGREKEAILVDTFRQNGALTMSLVAVRGNEIVGHVAFSPVTIEPPDGNIKAITLAPIAVPPPYQRQGIGSLLMQTSVKECRKQGYDLIVLVGHPEYYPRFGFVRANTKGLRCEFEEVPDEAWMVLELRQDILTGDKRTVKFRQEIRDSVADGF